MEKSIPEFTELFPEKWTGERLREYRKELKLKLKDVGMMTGYSAQAFSLLERGVTTGPLNLIGYAEVLNRYAERMERNGS